MGCLLWHHCLIAIHRFITVVHPNILRCMSVKVYVLVSLFLTRTLPIICCIPSFLTNSIAYSPQALRCSIRNKLQIYINITILILLPNVIIIFCFVRIFLHVLHATYASGRLKMNTISISHSLRREIHITKMFAILFTLFFFGYHPYGFVRAYDKRRQLHPDIYVLLTLLYCISICASPLVYGVMNDQLRHECMRVLSNFWHCQKIDNYKKYSCHGLNSSVIQPLTVKNAGVTRAKNHKNSSDLTSTNTLTVKSSEKRSYGIPISSTTYV